MKKILSTTLAGALLFISTASVVDAAPVSIFEGSTIRLSVDVPSIGNTIGGPYDAVVGSSIEFGPHGSGGGYNVVSADIDLSKNSIYFDYSSAGSGYFASGTTFNGYVFTDLNDTISDIMNVGIDTAITTLGIDNSRVFFNGDQIFVNVDGLSFNSDSRIKLDVDFASVPIPGAVWLLGSGLAGLAGIGTRRRK